MKYRVILSPEARVHYHGLSAYDRARVRDAIDTHLQNSPTAQSKSRIKRLRNLNKPQFRLRVANVRVFYDVEQDQVIVLGIVTKAHADEWLAETGEEL